MADAVFHDDQARPTQLIGKVLDRLCRLFAMGAGVTLILMALMSLSSIVGRTFFDKPILGDYELVQMMSAVAVSMSLPFCQMIGGHIIVDFFTTATPPRFNRALDIIAALILSGVGFLFSARIFDGLVDLRQTGDASMLLNLPTWWGYVPMVPSFFLLGCAGLYTAWVKFSDASA